MDVDAFRHLSSQYERSRNGENVSCEGYSVKQRGKRGEARTCCSTFQNRVRRVNRDSTINTEAIALVVGRFVTVGFSTRSSYLQSGVDVNVVRFAPFEQDVNAGSTPSVVVSN
jgi:hypothetical protein